jgi:hypothetical protein
MARFRKTSTKVGMNAKISSVNLQSIPTAGLVIGEGQPVRFGSDGYAAAGISGSPCYVNFVDSARADVMSVQGDPFQDDLDARNTESGTLTGIRGNGVDIGLPADCWDGGVLPAVNEGVGIVNGKFSAVAIGDLAGASIFGVVERISGGKAFFCFSSVPFLTEGA